MRDKRWQGQSHFTLLCLALLILWTSSREFETAPRSANSPKPVRTYKLDFPSLVEISDNGKVLLTVGSRNIPCPPEHPCPASANVLAIYDTTTGSRTAEL